LTIANPYLPVITQGVMLDLVANLADFLGISFADDTFPALSSGGVLASLVRGES